MRSVTSEKQLIELWHKELRGRTDLTTEDGKIIDVIYPGRPNDDRGADLREAAVLMDSELMKGDIEFHLRSSQWQAHGHHRDPTYNRVILHVVLYHDAAKTTDRQNGTAIPVLALHNYLTRASEEHNGGLYCRGRQNLSLEEVTEFIDNAGKKRFQAKSGKFHHDIIKLGPDQALYRGLMGALGYVKNKLPFEELSSRVPLSKLASLAASSKTNEEWLVKQQALLTGTAGLLPSQSKYRQGEIGMDAGWMKKLEHHWASYNIKDVMLEHDWHLIKVRPQNHPFRRIIAMSYLVLRHREKGIFEGLMGRMKRTLSTREHGGLEEALVISEGCRLGDFGFPSGDHRFTSALLGQDRAAIITVNVLLPFTFAWTNLTGQRNLVKKVLSYYGQHPKLATNSVEKHMAKQLGISSRVVHSAQRQQGLLHIYQARCIQGECPRCPLGGNRDENNP